MQEEPLKWAADTIIVPEKSPNDARTYEAIKLPNQIQLLLVHDPQAERGACSVSVNVGSLRDGERSLGLAHFLEHMLFMGSRSFPRHNEYSQFISLNSGMDNAWTSDEETNYYFQVASGKFIEGVERLTDFFVQALLAQECITKERQAVHEECQLRCGQDNSRKWEILKHFASGPYHNHSIGNNNTLSHPLVGQDLKNFYQKEYSANRTTAVLLSSLSLEEMREKAIPLFLRITDKKLEPIKYDLHFESGKLGKEVRMKSIKDESILEFFWVIDSLRPHYHTHPEKYITHVLGHQGKNSLLSELKRREYASKIVAYSHDLPRQSIVGLEIQLTEDGVEHYEQVYNLVIDYCSWLKADPHTYAEIAAASQVAFQFKEKSPNYSYVTDLSSTMHRIPLPQVISHRAHYGPFDGTLLDGFLGQLNPFNLLLFYSNSQELENFITEPHLGGTFIIRDLPKRVKEGIHFQPLVRNPFLPLATAVHPPAPSNTLVIKRDNIYFARGKSQVCKGGVQLLIHSHQNAVFLELYSAYLELLFKETTYQAETLKLEVEYDDEDEVKISIFGFSDTVEKLLKQIAPTLTTAHNSENAESLFQLAIEDLLEEYENFYFGEVDEIVETHLDTLLTNTGIPVPKALEILEGYEYEDFCKLIKDFWSRASLQWVVVGNFEEKFLQTLKQQQKLIKCGTEVKDKQPLSCAKIDRDLTYSTKLTAEQITTSGCIRYHEVGIYNELSYYTLMLLVNYIKEPFFDKLRTEKQLAYYLRAYQNNTRGVLSLNFILISSNTPPHAISQHISQFCATFLQEAQKDLTPEKFEMIKTSVRTKVLEPHNSLKDYFEFICREIDNRTFLFTRKEKETLEQYLGNITRDDVLGLLKRSLEKSLQIWVVAKGHEEEFDKVGLELQSYEEIKASLEYYPEWTNVFKG